MKQKPARYVFYGATVALAMNVWGCRTSENFSFPKQQLSAAPAPVMVWEPEYVTYRQGKYQFVQGYFRPVINRKEHFKRSLRGYMTKVPRN